MHLINHNARPLADARQLLAHSARQMPRSARADHRIRKHNPMIATIAGSEGILGSHVAEAILCRPESAAG
ncbi:MAG: hypothetical protein H6672_08140 [Anaerolineaceae bacterium]|nr:hypothetical protein [Anaerolineaceae bacterium]